MTDSYKYKLTSKNFTFLLIGTTQHVILLQLTRRSSEYAGHDAWISILLASIFAFGSLLIINKLCSRMPALSLAEINDKICGRFIGKAISLIYVIYFVVCAALVIRLFVEVLNSYLLVRTPGLVISLVLVITATYIFSRDIRVIAWMNELTLYIIQVLWVFLLYGLTMADFSNLLPVGDAGAKNIILGTQGAFFAYLGTEILLLIYPYIQNKKEIIKAGLIGIAFNVIIYLAVAIITIMAFGEKVLHLLVWDFLALIKTYRLPVIEQAEFFVVIFWSWLVIRSSANFLYMAKHTIAKGAGIKEKHHVYIYGGLAIVVFVISQVPQNTAQVINFTYPLGMIGVLLMMTGLPAFLWVISVIRGVNGK